MLLTVLDNLRALQGRVTEANRVAAADAAELGSLAAAAEADARLVAERGPEGLLLTGAAGSGLAAAFELLEVHRSELEAAHAARQAEPGSGNDSGPPGSLQHLVGAASSSAMLGLGSGAGGAYGVFLAGVQMDAAQRSAAELAGCTAECAARAHAAQAEAHQRVHRDVPQLVAATRAGAEALRAALAEPSGSGHGGEAAGVEAATAAVQPSRWPVFRAPDVASELGAAGRLEVRLRGEVEQLVARSNAMRDDCQREGYRDERALLPHFWLQPDRLLADAAALRRRVAAHTAPAAQRVA